MKVKHSKYKNTGILFELLTRQLTSDTITGNQSKSLSFLKKHFNKKTELLKELLMYQKNFLFHLEETLSGMTVIALTKILIELIYLF